MKKTIRLLAVWKDHTGAEHPTGTVLELDSAKADELITAKSAEAYTPPAPETVQKQVETAVKSAVKEAVAEAMKASNLVGNKLVHIEVRDRQMDDDPLHGYGDSNKSAKELTPGEIMAAAGKFCKDVFLACRAGGRETETLTKSRIRTDELIRKAAGDGMIIAQDEAGGYTIPTAIGAFINARALEAGIVRPRATRLTLGTQTLSIPFLQDTTHATGTVFGGIAVYCDDENVAATESKPKLGRLEFKLKKLAAAGYASEEWIKWSSVTLGTWLIPRFADALAWKEDLLFFWGNGVGQPKGIFNAPALISVAKSSSQTATTFNYLNVGSMYSRLMRGPGSNIAWVMNPNVFPQLLAMNAAAGVMVWQPDATGKPAQSLIGYPIEYSEKCETLGTTKDVLLADFADYAIADDQSGPSVAQSIHLKFLEGQTCFRITKFVDGQPITNSALTPYKGSTSSPYVILDVRS